MRVVTAPGFLFALVVGEGAVGAATVAGALDRQAGCRLFSPRFRASVPSLCVLADSREVDEPSLFH